MDLKNELETIFSEVEISRGARYGTAITVKFEGSTRYSQFFVHYGKLEQGARSGVPAIRKSSVKSNEDVVRKIKKWHDNLSFPYYV